MERPTEKEWKAVGRRNCFQKCIWLFEGGEDKERKGIQRVPVGLGIPSLQRDFPEVASSLSVRLTYCTICEAAAGNYMEGLSQPLYLKYTQLAKSR